MTMPMNYNVLTEEEMTYVDGGSTWVDVAIDWLVPFAAAIRGVVCARNWYKSTPNPTFEGGVNTLSRYMEASLPNALCGIARTIEYCCLVPWSLLLTVV